MKRPHLLALTLIALLLLATLLEQRPRPQAAEPPTPIALADVVELSELVTLEVPMQQLVESRLAGYTGSTHCILIARGTALISTDLAAGKLVLDHHERMATVTLPVPRVLSCTLDQAGTGVAFVTRTGLWSYVPGPAGEMQVAEQALARAQRQMRQAAGEPRRIRHAQRRTQKVLSDWVQRQGWTLKIDWRPP